MKTVVSEDETIMRNIVDENIKGYDRNVKYLSITMGIDPKEAENKYKTYIPSTTTNILISKRATSNSTNIS